jgi:UDP-GlcNAc:undecaprenyl-phosphate/decaprenyl-phosphate GlcNAc-1-phosphate transferase
VEVSVFNAMLAVLFVTSILFAGVFTWLVRDLAEQFRWTCEPITGRHIHARAIPRLGGVAVYCTFMPLWMLYCWATPFLGVQATPGFASYAQAIFVSATIMFAVGLLDDIWNLKAGTKLLFQILSASYLYMNGISIGSHLLVRDHHYQFAISYIATVFWVILISNAINLIDGIDGLAAGGALFATITILVMAIVGQQNLLAFASVALAGSLIGFLKFNSHPATIFMGDGGSLFLGSMLASLSLLGRHLTGHPPFSLTIPIVALGFPIMETLLSVGRRLIRGISIFLADRNHVHHRLLDMGLSQRQVVVVLYGVCAIFMSTSIVLMYPNPYSRTAVWIVLGVMAVMGIGRLGYAEFDELAAALWRTLHQRRVISHDVAFRVAAVSLAHATSLDESCAILKDAAEGCGLCEFHLTIETRNLGYHTTDSAPVIMQWSALKPRPEQATCSFSMHLQTDDVADIGKLIVKGDVGNGRLLFEADVLILILLPALSSAIVRIAQSRAVSLRRMDDPSHVSLIEEAAPKTAYAPMAARQAERPAVASEL